MSPDVARQLAPHQQAVNDATMALDAANQGETAHPLDSLAAAGLLIKRYAAYTDTMRGLLDTVGITPEHPEWPRLQLQIHGRLNALAALDSGGLADAS